MLITRKVSQLQLGGNGADNPVPFGDANFDFDEEQAKQPRRNVNVTVYHNNQHATLQVTGKANVDSSGAALLGPNDTIYLPCPPFCEEGD